MNSRSSFYIPRSPALHFACSSPLSGSAICDYRMCRLHGYLAAFFFFVLSSLSPCLSLVPLPPDVSRRPVLRSAYDRVVPDVDDVLDYALVFLFGRVLFFADVVVNLSYVVVEASRAAFVRKEVYYERSDMLPPGIVVTR